MNGNNTSIKKISGFKGLFELRIMVSSGYRIYFALLGNRIQILLGGKKDTQKRDIEMAYKYLVDYRKGFMHGKSM